MKRHSILSAALAAAASLPLGAAAVEFEQAVPLAPYGDSGTSSFAGATALTPNSFLVATPGPDATVETADDQVLLIRDLDGTPTSTPLATPALANYGDPPVRVSPHRALVRGGGPDGTLATADDELYLLDDLQGMATVTPIPIGYVNDEHSWLPTVLDESTVVVVNAGLDGSMDSADDRIAVVSDLGGTNQVTFYPAPFLDSAGSAPTVLSPSSFALGSNGPDAFGSTADDLVYVFRDGGAIRVQVATPYRAYYRGGIPARLSPTRAMVATRGPDGVIPSADDGLLLLDELDGAPTVTPLPLPGLHNYRSAQVAVLDGDTVAIPTRGADLTETTGDDLLVLYSDLGGTNQKEELVIGSLNPQTSSQPQPLTADRVALVSYGPDLTLDTPDDEVVVVSHLRDSPEIDRYPAGGVRTGVTSLPVPLTADALAISHGGADGDLGAGGDDAIRVLLLDDTAGSESVASGDDFDTGYALAYRVVPLGGGRGVHLGAGADDDLGAGGDDEVRVLRDLPQRSLATRKLRVKFDPAKPQKGEKLKLKGTLDLDGLVVVGPADLRITVGNVTQTLPASAFRVKKKSVSYKDRKGENGFFRKVKISLRSGKVSIKGKGIGTGLESLAPGELVVAMDFGERLYTADLVDAAAAKRGLVYKAPKN